MDWKQLWEILSAADNVPIIAMIPLLAFYIYLAWKQAHANDLLIEQLAGDAALAKTHHRPALGRRWVERDVGRELATYHIEEDMGRFTMDRLGLETDFVQSEAYRIGEDDPLSAEIDIRYVISIGRKEWQTRTETRTIMRADKMHFILEASLEAFEGDKRVLSRQWQERIPRDFA